MGELYNPFPKLPKNIRQIGERDQSVRLYLEDYVNTYLKRLYPRGGQDLRVGILLGNVEEHDGTPYLFVDGAMEMEEVTESGEKVAFTEPAWKKAYQGMEQMFPKRVILGWFLCGAPGSTLSPLNYWKEHGQYFAGKNQLMYLNSGLEGEEAVYITSEDGFYKLRGYSIYYERNQMMQDYMILRKDARRVESGTGDTVIRDFRQRMEDNRIQAVSRRGTIRVLGSLCSALSVVVLAGGVVMFNNYEKMREMESVLTSAFPVVSKGTDNPAAMSGEQLYEEYKDNDDIGQGDQLLVEEAQGNVLPTAGRETMSPTYPGETPAETDSSANGQAAATQQAQEASSQQAAPEGGETGSALEETGESPAQAEETSPAAQSVAAGAEDYSTYVVQDGETLYSICLDRYSSLSRVDEICKLNNLESQDKIISGQKLILP